MTVPEPIGALMYNEPRAVLVRSNPQDTSQVHTAIHSSIAIHVDSKTEADAILSSWRVIMQAAADQANAILTALRTEQPTPMET